MMEYTLLQAAKIFNVSKNTIKYRVTKLPAGYTSVDANGVTVITEAGLDELRKSFESAPSKIPVPEQPHPVQPPASTTSTDSFNHSTTNNHQTTTDKLLIESLQQRIESLERQLSIKDNQIESLETMLKTQQELLKTAQSVQVGLMSRRLIDGEAVQPPEEPVETAPEPVPEPQQMPENKKRTSLLDWIRGIR